jgi:hypothetical protein
MEVSFVHVTPVLLEVHMFPLYAAAASFVPSADGVILYQFFIAPTEVSFVQVAPLLLEVHMLPPYTIAASFVLSTEEVIACQSLVPSATLTSVQLAAADTRSIVF